MGNKSKQNQDINRVKKEILKRIDQGSQTQLFTMIKTDTLTKLLIEKGIITEEEFRVKLLENFKSVENTLSPKSESIEVEDTKDEPVPEESNTGN